LEQNQITDASALTKLTKLESVSLQGNKVTGTLDFSSSPQLRSLNLSFNPLQFAPKLTGLQSLTQLLLSSTELLSFSGLGLPSLTDLHVDGNPATDYSPLATATHVQGLMAGGTDTVSVTDLSALASMTELATLTVNYAKPSSFAWLTPLTKLGSLSFSYVTFGQNGVKGIEALPLTYVYIAQSDLADLTPFKSLSQLGTLYLYDSAYTDLTPLVENAGIGANDYLYLSSKSFDCTEQAANLTALRSRVLVVYSLCP
jgi:internalin A